MRIVSHTCSNTEIVCALGGADHLIGVDQDSDYPADTVAQLPKLGRDLNLDIEQVLKLQPDLVLSSLTVPGHERIVAELQASGIPTYIADPQSLEAVFDDIRAIAELIGRKQDGDQLVRSMTHQMPASPPRSVRPRILVEWWPKPVIVPARQSWVTDLIERAGGRNPWSDVSGKSISLDSAPDTGPDAIVISWCGVPEHKYRAEVVRNRTGWGDTPAVRNDHIYPITEAWLGRPGPRLVQGYQALRGIIENLQGED